MNEKVWLELIVVFFCDFGCVLYVSGVLVYDLESGLVVVGEWFGVCVEGFVVLIFLVFFVVVLDGLCWVELFCLLFYDYNMVCLIVF